MATTVDFHVPLLDYVATFSWAASGAVVAIRKRFDIVGVFVVALLSSIGGGLLRDGFFLQRIPAFLVNPVYLPLIVLPSGSKLQGGTLSAELGITGPIDKLVITGPVRLSNAQLAGFDLGSRLGALSAFAGKARSSRDTSIQNASLNARVAPEGTQADSIDVSIPAIGVVTGAGTISPAGALDFKMIAELEGGLAAGLTQRAGLSSSKNGGIPFSITGTMSDPKFVPNVAGVAEGVAEGALGNALAGTKGAAKGATGVTGAVGGLLGRKKPK